MSPTPRIARVPHTSKVPETCPYCGSHVLTRRGTRKKKLEIVQLWRCSSCKRVFTPAAQQDLSAPYDPVGAHRLRHRLHPRSDGGASAKESAPSRLDLNSRVVARRIQTALQLPATAR